MVSRPKRRAVVHPDDPASPIIANRAGPSGWNSGVLPHPIRETSDEEHSDACDPASFADWREKRRLNRQAALQFIDSMAAVEGESNSGPDADEDEENNSIASTIALLLEMIFSSEPIYFTFMLSYFLPLN